MYRISGSIASVFSEHREGEIFPRPYETWCFSCGRWAATKVAVRWQT